MIGWAQLVGRGWLVVGRLVGCLCGWLVDCWLVGRSVIWFVGLPVDMTVLTSGGCRSRAFSTLAFCLNDSCALPLAQCTANFLCFKKPLVFAPSRAPGFQLECHSHARTHVHTRNLQIYASARAKCARAYAYTPTRSPARVCHPNTTPTPPPGPSAPGSTMSPCLMERGWPLRSWGWSSGCRTMTGGRRTLRRRHRSGRTGEGGKKRKLFQ